MDFSEIYKRYSRDVYLFSLYLCGNFAVAEDLTAETFMRALCGPAVLHVDTLKAYLLAIARNLHRDSLDRARRQVSISHIRERADAAPTAYEAAADREKLSTVLNAIQRLPETQREALVLSMDEELRYDQIAAILRCSVASVKVRVHRARRQLRLDIERQEGVWKE